MGIEEDIQRISEQERRLVCAEFDLDKAWQLGSRLREVARSRNLPLTIEIRLARETVFFSAMPGVTPANADWARRKRNTVELLHRSSYGVGRTLSSRALFRNAPYLFFLCAARGLLTTHFLLFLLNPLLLQPFNLFLDMSGFQNCLL